MFVIFRNESRVGAAIPDVSVGMQNSWISSLRVVKSGTEPESVKVAVTVSGVPSVA